MIYDTQQRIRNFKLYNDADVAKFLQIYYKNGKQTNADMGRMTSLLKPVLERYNDLTDEEKYQFRVSIRNFNKWYAYIIQITRLFDKELHQEICLHLLSEQIHS